MAGETDRSNRAESVLMNEVPRRTTLSISPGIRQETHSIKLLSLVALLLVC